MATGPIATWPSVILRYSADAATSSTGHRHMSTFINLASAPFLVATAFLTALGIYGIRTDEAFGDMAGAMLLVAAAGSLWLGCVLLGLSKIIDHLDDIRVSSTRERHQQIAD